MSTITGQPTSRKLPLIHKLHLLQSGQSRDRTGDLRIFSPSLYQLSYLSAWLPGKRWRASRSPAPRRGCGSIRQQPSLYFKRLKRRGNGKESRPQVGWALRKVADTALLLLVYSTSLR